MSPWPSSVCPQRGGKELTSRENKPVFIALEGGEGAGKSTQAQLLVTRLQQEGRPSWSTNPEQPRWVNT